jgi:hypothetical protein
MIIRIDLPAALRTKWYEYAVRFIFGGLITVGAGVIARNYGPTVGGLFLAFPAIFPASVTLVDKHEKDKKLRAGIDGTSRGRLASGLDARGAAIGSLGLITFAIVIWRGLGEAPAWGVLTVGVFLWSAVSISLWYLRRMVRS